MRKSKNMKFILNGCNIWFIAEAPEYITLKQLIKQCDKIKPDYCACGLESFEKFQNELTGDYERGETDIFIGYDSISKTNDDVACTIIKNGEIDENK